MYVFDSSVVHKEGFVLFIISSLIYMLITCRLWRSIKEYSLCYEVKNAQTHTAYTYIFIWQFHPLQYIFFTPEQDAKSHHWKVRFLILNVSFCAFAGFFFWKHNMYCESGSKYQTCSVFFNSLHVFSQHWIYWFVMSSPYRLHTFRSVWVSGGLLQHGLPSHSNLGLPEQGHHGHFLLWR